MPDQKLGLGGRVWNTNQTFQQTALCFCHMFTLAWTGQPK